jgi:hypothetical protein
VGNCTERNLCRPEDAKAFYQPLQFIARRQNCAGLCLTHLNAAGQFLGRRVLEKVRTAILIDQPREDDDRRRVRITKSNRKKPEPLGMSVGDDGNSQEYDDDPPVPLLATPSGPAVTPAVAKAAEWLRKALAAGSAELTAIRAEAEKAGIKPPALYGASKLLKVIESNDQEGHKRWCLPNVQTPFPGS